MENTEIETTIKISPKSPDSRWVALDKNNKIIAEGKNPLEVTMSARQIGGNFIMMFVPEEGMSYTF